MLWRTLIGLASAIVLVWIVLVLVLLITRPKGSLLKEAMRLLPDTLRLLKRLATDGEVPRGARVRLWLLFGYLAMPIDLVPDFIPVLGYADDAIIVAAVLRSVVRRAGPEAVRRNWPGTEDGLASLWRVARLPGTPTENSPPGQQAIFRPAMSENRRVFIQAIIGKVSDASATRTAFERLSTELQSHPSGFLGLTAGVSEDGTSVAIVRFASVAAAQANSVRAEQRAWWAETVKLFEGDVAVLDCDEVLEFLDGGSNDAGFVQVLVGTVIDAVSARSVPEAAAQALREVRPDIIGGTRAFAGDLFVETVYFRSEAAAREAESKELPQIVRDLDAPVQIEQFINLRHTWFA